MLNNKIRIRLKSFDFNLINQCISIIIKTLKFTGVIIRGPIPLPIQKEKFTVLTSPHVDKDARDQYEICIYKRLLDILNVNENIFNLLMRLDIGIGVDIKVFINKLVY